MTFKLLRKKSDRAKTVFHVTNTAGDILGSISVRPEEEADLLRRFGPADNAGPPSSSAVGRRAMAKCLKTLPFNEAGQRAILRGCN